MLGDGGLRGMLGDGGLYDKLLIYCEVLALGRLIVYAVCPVYSVSPYFSIYFCVP